MLGIDVSADRLHTALWYRDAPAPAWQKRVSNDPAGIRALLSATPADVPWVLEPTGRHSLRVVQLAREAGRTVLSAPPRKAKLYMSSLQDRAKTDPLDGRGLALFGLSRKLEPYPVKTEAVDQLDQLLSARKGLSRSLTSLRLQRDALPYAEAKAAIEPAVRALTAQIEALDKKIAARSKEHPDFSASQKLLKVHGIGPVTAAALTSRLASKRFPHPDKFVAYVGLDVAVRQSGKREGRKGLTKQGDAELRRLLYVCALAAVRAKDNPFKEQYHRERAKGLSTVAALCAVARKMAQVCWSIHKHGTDYDPARVNRRPKKQQEVTDPTPPPDDNLDNQP